MSKYTTEVRFICEEASNLSDSKGFNNVNEIIKLALPKIFNFSFPIFDEEYRSVLETKILKHFYTREIGEETVGLWKLRLDSRLNEIMPYYNKMYLSELLEFNPLYTKNITTTSKRNTNTDTKDNNDTTSNQQTNANSNSSNTNWNLYLDTPQNGINDLSEEHYLTNATKNTDNGTSGLNSNTSSNVKIANTGNAISVDDYIEHVVGYDGNNASELLLKYRQTFINIDMLIIDELEDLFIQIW